MPAPSPEDRTSPISPQLAARVAVLGGIAFVLFAVIFFRLWFLQVLTGDEYVVEARENRVRKDPIEAPRGDVVDRSGDVKLVTSRKSRVVIIKPDLLPEVGNGERTALYKRLGRVIGMTAHQIQKEVLDQRKRLPYADVVLKTDVEPALYGFIKERIERFPGVDVKWIYLREYPFKKLAAHVFGYTREISPEQLKQDLYRGVDPGTRVGVGGLEEIYDRYLRGINGFERIQIDALGQRKRNARTSVKQPVQGNRLRISLDAELQKEAEKSLARGLEVAASTGNAAKAGAFVAMDPRNGEILAIGSAPSFDANEFSKPISQTRYNELNSPQNGAPLFNRALQGQFPVGSTFKPITAASALEDGYLGPREEIFDDGEFKIGNIVQRNARGAKYGSIDVAKALQVSSDVFFYTLGERANPLGPKIQRWARKLGLDKITNIDLPGEFDGTVPDSRFINRKHRAYVKCAEKHKLDLGTWSALRKCGGYERPWSAGDNTNLAVGQGYVQATPLQMAVAYGALFTDRVVTPRLGVAVEDGAGREIQEVAGSTPRKLGMSERTRSLIEEGLRRAAMEDGGTSASVFKNFGKLMYGKTGTVERGAGNPDQSWYIAYVPDEETATDRAPEARRPIVVAVTIEGGGFGAESAAPVARQILSQYYKGDPGPWQAGTVED